MSHSSKILALSLTILLVFCALACMPATPLQRSYDDAYNAPEPNKPAPPNTTPSEEICVREGDCTELCTQDKDCNENQLCYKAKCIDKPE